MQKRGSGSKTNVGRKKLPGKLYYFRAVDEEDERKVKKYAEKLFNEKNK
jgi:hypothetical protein